MEVMMAVMAEDLVGHADGTLDILGITTGLRVGTVPHVESRMNLFVSFSASPAEVGMEKLVQVHLLDADGDLMRTAQTIQTVPEPPRPGSRSDFNLGLPLTDVPFLRAGEYGFHIFVGDDEKRTVPFYISVDEGEL